MRHTSNGIQYSEVDLNGDRYLSKYEMSRNLYRASVVGVPSKDEILRLLHFVSTKLVTLSIPVIFVVSII